MDQSLELMEDPRQFVPSWPERENLVTHRERAPRVLPQYGAD